MKDSGRESVLERGPIPDRGPILRSWADLISEFTDRRPIYANVTKHSISSRYSFTCNLLKQPPRISRCRRVRESPWKNKLVVVMNFSVITVTS